MCSDGERRGCWVRCARWRCNRPFVICELCDAGQKYCCEACEVAARDEQVRRAKCKYGRSFKGRMATSWRNRRLRERKDSLRAKSLRKIETDHPSTQDPPGVTDALDEVRAADGSTVGAKEGPRHDVDSQVPRTFRKTGEVGLSRPAREPAPSLDRCRFCASSVQLFVDRDRLRASRRRRVPEAKRKRRARLPVGPGGVRHSAFAA
jgi:hypothetical protein